MTEVKPSTYIVAIIIFGMLVTGGMSVLSMLRTEKTDFGTDSPELIDSFNNTFNVMDDVTSAADNFKTPFNSTETESTWGTFGVLDALIKTSWNTLKGIFSSLNFMTAAIMGLNTVFGIPTWVTAGLLSIITIMLAFAIFGAIFQRDL